MNIVFFGTSEFAIPSLRVLIGSRHKVVALVTQPDRKRGRLLKLMPPPTKVLALTRNIPVHQPIDASSSETVQYLKSLDPDIFVVVSFGQILKKTLLEIPRHYAINVHGSLLPKYRGAAPTNMAIINGDAVSGVTIMRMNEQLDEGDIITRTQVTIEDGDTNITLSEKLSELGAQALLAVVDAIADGKQLSCLAQDPQQASYVTKLTKEDGRIDWDLPARDIHNKVRGLLPWPGAFTYYNGKILKVLKTEIVNIPALRTQQPGQVIDIVRQKGLIVRTGEGAIAISHLQLEGKKILDADSFLRGHRIEIGYRFGQ